MTYQIHNTLDGSVTNCSLSELSRACRPSSNIVELNDDGTTNNIWSFDRNADVKFAREFIEFATNNYVKPGWPDADSAADVTAADAYTAASFAEKLANSHFYASDYKLASKAVWAAAETIYMDTHSNWPGVGAHISAIAAFIAFIFSCTTFGWYAIANCIFMFAIMTLDKQRTSDGTAWEEFKVQHSAAASCAFATFKAATRSGKEAEYRRQGEFIVEYMTMNRKSESALNLGREQSLARWGKVAGGIPDWTVYGTCNSVPPTGHSDTFMVG